MARAKSKHRRRGPKPRTTCSVCGVKLTPAKRKGGRCAGCFASDARVASAKYHRKMMATSGEYVAKMGRKKQAFLAAQREFARAKVEGRTVKRAEVWQRKASKDRLRKLGFA